MDTTTKVRGRPAPWNKGKLLGQKPPLKLKEIWAIWIRLQMDHRSRELALFTSPSTANCADAIWSPFAFVMWSRAFMSPHARLSCRRRRSDRCNLRSPSKRGHYLDCGGPAEAGAIPLPEPHVGVAPSFDSAVLPNRRCLGGIDWTRSGGLRHPFNAAHQADADLPAHQESPGGPASTWSQQT